MKVKRSVMKKSRHPSEYNHALSVMRMIVNIESPTK